jgi:hypothetical protein
MKKTILLGTLLFTLFSHYSFAGRKVKEIDERVKASFNREFVNAEEVQWVDMKSYIKVNFKVVNQALSAYFNPDGELLAVTRNISSNQLPIGLLLTLKTKYAGYWITDLLEMNDRESSIYFATVTNGDREILLKSQQGNSWQVYRKKRRLPLSSN